MKSFLPSAILLTVCLVCRAQDSQCPAYTHACVSFFQCIDGVINTSGIGIIDPRFGTRSSCTVPDTGEFGVCCKIPDATVPTCSGDEICVSNSQCKPDGTINTDGTGLIDIRRSLNCVIPNTNTKGVCCSPPILDTCPGDASCVESGKCTTSILNENNAYVPHNQGGSWAKCKIITNTRRLGVSLTGICCQNADKYEAAKVCGVRNTGGNFVTRIRPQLDKKTTEFGEYPWQAVIFHSNYTFICGATLISNQWLVTAAHCVHNLRNLKVRLGEWVVNDNKEPIAPKDFGVRQLIIHPFYNPFNLHNDIALLKLDYPINYEYHINRVCIPDENRQFYSGTRCFATGWGKNAFDGQFQATLKQVDLPVIDNGQCQNQLRKTILGSFFRLHDSFVCAGGEPNKDVCKGDGGGPLVCEDTNTGSYFLHGITAWGISCGEAGVPGVYVNVAKFSDWIWQNADQ